jgi:hypothetical protein
MPASARLAFTTGLREDLTPVGLLGRKCSTCKVTVFYEFLLRYQPAPNPVPSQCPARSSRVGQYNLLLTVAVQHPSCKKQLSGAASFHCYQRHSERTSQ